MLFKTLAYERIIHALKTALACLIGFGVAKFISFHADQWMMITILVVMCAQINVGGVINKSILRFLGTLLGSLLAALTLMVFGSNYLTIVIIITLSALIFSYIATGGKKYSDAGTLGAVTVTIILLGIDPTMLSAWERFSEISLGILIAAMVSQFVLPVRARDHLRRMQAKTIGQMGEYYQITFVANPNEMAVQELDEAIVQSLSSQRTLAKESARELFSAHDSEHFNKLLVCEKEIFRSIVCMHYASDMMPAGKNIFISLQALQHFHLAICTAFTQIARGIEQKKISAMLVSIPALQPLKDAIHSLRTALEKDDMIYLDGLVFCAEILVVHLTKMVMLLKMRL